MAWTVNVGQGTGIRSLKRISNITVVEEWAHSSFSVTIQNPTAEDRNQAKGRIDDAIIQIKRGSEILLEGYIEDVEKGPNYVKYTGRSFLILLGYSTSSETDKTTQETKAEYTNESAKDIIKDLIKNYCYTKDSELTYTDIDFTDDDGLDIEYKGTLKLHGKKVYDIICDMCSMYAKDIWSDATWNGNNVDNKNIHIGIKGDGDSENPHKTLYAGIHFKEMPVVKYRTQSDMINCLRVIGKGTGKDRVSVWCEDTESISNYGYIEGSPYISNLIVDKDTATEVGNAIINDKKELVEQLYIDLIYYIGDLKYGDWVKIIDSYSDINTIKRIKKITKVYDSKSGDSMQIEVGSMFNNYEKIIQDLTKKDVDSELEMTRFGGSLKATANDPPDNFIRIDGGDFYDSTGTLQTAGNGVCLFSTGSGSRILPSGSHHPGNGNYKKALIEIKDEDLTVWYHVGTEYGDINDAKNENVPVDSGFTPICEVILKGKGDDKVHPVYDSENSNYSFIYRDCRPIVGTSSSGYGDESLWEVSGGNTQLKEPDSIDMQSTTSNDYKILDCGGIDLYDGNSSSPRLNFRVPLYEGFSGFYLNYCNDNCQLEFKNRENNDLIFGISDYGDIKVTNDILLINKGSYIYFASTNAAYIYQDSTNNNLMFKDPNTNEISLSDLISGGEVTWDDITNKPDTATKWPTWEEVTDKPTNFEYTSNKNVANGYCGLDSNKNIVLDNAMIMGLNSLQAYSDETNEGIGLYALVGSEYQLQGLLAMDDCALRCNLAGIDMDGNDIKNAYNINIYHPGSSVYDWLYIKSQSGEFTLATLLTYNDTMGEILIGDNVDIKGVTNIYARDSASWGTIYFKTPNGTDIMKLISYNNSSLTIDMYGNLNVNGHIIDNVGEISGNSTVSLSLDFIGDDSYKIWKDGDNLMFKDANNSSGISLSDIGLWEEFDSTSIQPKGYDNIYVKKISFDFSGDDACKIWKDGDNLMFMDGYNLSGVSLSDIGLWEEVDITTIRPKGYTIIQGRSGYDLTIKPDSGHILYLG